MRSNTFSRLCLSFACLASLALPALACAAPAQRVEIAYELSRNGAVIAESVETLEHDGKVYRISARMKGKALLALRGDAARTSQGRISPEGLRPAEFDDQRSGRDTLRAKFDWQAKTLSLQPKEGVSESKPLAANMHDRLSYLYNFAFRPPGSSPIGLSITDGKGVATVVYEPGGRETLKTPAGEFETLKLARRKNGPEDRTTEIWLAARRDYLPVRILVVEKDGTRIDQVVTRLSVQ